MYSPHSVNHNRDIALFSLGTAAVLGALGAVGGSTLHTLTNTSPMAHALALGGAPLVGGLIFKVADEGRMDVLAKIALTVFGGYFSSWALTNLSGNEISFLAPFVGVATFVGTSAVVIAAIAIPVLMVGFCIVVCR